MTYCLCCWLCIRFVSDWLGLPNKEPFGLSWPPELKSKSSKMKFCAKGSPKIANLVSAELQANCVVVFDECHNIDNACIEALSMNLNVKSLERANEQLKELQRALQKEKESGSERLK